MNRNPWKNLVGKKVKIPRLYTFGRNSDPEMLKDEWTVKVTHQNGGKIMVENSFMYNVEIPTSDVIEILED